jgi:hypothetical protein
METVLEGSDDTKIPPAASHAPKKVFIFGRAGGQESTIGRDDIDREQVIATQAVFPGQPPHASTEGEAGNAGIGDDARRGSQVERLGLVVEFPQLNTGLGAGRAPERIDAHAFHLGQVNHETPVTEGVARNAVPTSSDGHQQVVGAGKIDGINHVGHASTADNQGGPFANHSIPDGTSFLVALITGTEQWATQAGLESLHGGLVKDRISAPGSGHAQVCHGCLFHVSESEIDITPNSQIHLLPEAGAQRTLEAVSCMP